MKLSDLPSDTLVHWAAARIPELQGPFDSMTAMGVESSKGDLMGVVVFHSWDPRSRTMQVSAAADDARWLLARSAVAAMRWYVFKTCDCQKIWSITPRANKRALRVVKAFGLTPEAILKRQLGDDDAVISGQFREQVYGEEGRKRAEAA